jgi:hypothetical protein
MYNNFCLKLSFSYFCRAGTNPHILRTIITSNIANSDNAITSWDSSALMEAKLYGCSHTPCDIERKHKYK